MAPFSQPCGIADVIKQAQISVFQLENWTPQKLTNTANLSDSLYASVCRF